MNLCALLLLASAPAEAPLPMEALALPAGFELPLVQGEADLRPESDATSGLVTVRREELCQSLSWESAQGTLLDATIHERSLVYRALEQAVPEDAPAPVGVEVAGTEGLSWEVDGAPTLFLGTSYQCFGTRIELTSYGPDHALIRQVHAASLAGAGCRPPGGLGTSQG
jgi:hypothetical protein